mgnify:CR=1 FL=1
MSLVFNEETVTIRGKTIPKIYGGFGEGQPAILAKQVSEVHGYTVKQINQLVYKNLDWFDEGIDYIDLKSIKSTICPGVISNDPSDKPMKSRLRESDKPKEQLAFLVKYGLYPTSQAVGGSKYIYLFSQQGYAMLCKLLKSDLAKQIYKQMIRDYFKMAEIQQCGKSSRKITKQKQHSEAQSYWLSGKLAEIILEAIQENREELNQIHLEIRDQREEISNIQTRMMTIEKKLTHKKNSSKTKNGMNR